MAWKQYKTWRRSSYKKKKFGKKTYTSFNPKQRFTKSNKTMATGGITKALREQLASLELDKKYGPTEKLVMSVSGPVKFQMGGAQYQKCYYILPVSRFLKSVLTQAGKEKLFLTSFSFELDFWHESPVEVFMDPIKVPQGCVPGYMTVDAAKRSFSCEPAGFDRFDERELLDGDAKMVTELAKYRYEGVARGDSFFGARLKPGSGAVKSVSVKVDEGATKKARSGRAALVLGGNAMKTETLLKHTVRLYFDCQMSIDLVDPADIVVLCGVRSKVAMKSEGSVKLESSEESQCAGKLQAMVMNFYTRVK